MRKVLQAVTVVFVLLLLVVPVAAQSGDIADAVPASEVGFWLVLAGIGLAAVVLSVLVNRYLASLENRLPPWVTGPVSAVAPYAYQQGSSYFNRYMDVLERRASKTPAEWDDELVKLVDSQGNRVLVKIVEVLGPDQPDTEKPESANTF